MQSHPIWCALCLLFTILGGANNIYNIRILSLSANHRSSSFGAGGTSIMIFTIILKLLDGHNNHHSVHASTATTTTTTTTTSASDECSTATATGSREALMEDGNKNEASLPTPTPTITSVEGVELPNVRWLDDGTPLYRNGHGIRSIYFFGMNIKVYVAHLYTLKSLSSEEQITDMLTPATGTMVTTTTTTTTSQSTSTSEPLSSSNKHNYDQPQPSPPPQHHHHHHHNPMHFDFTFLRHVGQSKVASAWTQQLEHSVSHRYDGYEQDRDTFIRLCSGGPIAMGGTQTVQLVGNETRVIDQGRLQGVITNQQFQIAFLSMWFGSKAVADDLKRNLLRGHDHQGVDPSLHQRRDAPKQVPVNA
jgi:hypothetical protein